MSTNNMAGSWSEVQADGSVTVTRPPTLAMMERRKAEAAEGARRFGTVPIHLDHPQRHYNDRNGNVVEVRYGSALPEGVPPDVPTILTAHEHENCLHPLIALIRQHDPVWILTHSMAQLDQEHVGTSLLVTKGFGEAAKSGYEGGVLHWREGFTHLGQLNAAWDIFVDITEYLDRKIDLIATHRCQIPKPNRPDFPPRVRALAWGNACGCESAEVHALIARGKAEMLR
jgi:LmbE family N-acetylglucosaminyl deacetylase